MSSFGVLDEHSSIRTCACRMWRLRLGILSEAVMNRYIIVLFLTLFEGVFNVFLGRVVRSSVYGMASTGVSSN